MTTILRLERPDVALVVLYLAAALPLQFWAYLVSPFIWMNYGPPLWPNFVAYAAVAPYVGYLLWRRSPRARFAAYTFLTFDVLRSTRLAHWLPLVLDVIIILYLQTPEMRRLYPSAWRRWGAVILRWAPR